MKATRCICQFCRSEHSPRQHLRELISYARGHSAHPDCFFHAYGLGGINKLSLPWLEALRPEHLKEVAPGREKAVLEAAIQNLKDRNARVQRMTRGQLKAALKEMRKLALEAIEIADRCHGGHSYTSIRSEEEGKCCEVRMQVDELKKEYVKQSEAHAVAGV